jgi:transposase
VARHSEQARTCLEQAGGAVVNRKRIEAVLHCAQTSRGLALSEGEQWELRELSLEMLRLQTKIAEAKRQTEELGAVHEPVQAMSAHVVGRLTAAILYNELGDPRQYGSARAYEKAAGLNLKERSSGQDGNEKKKKPLHITRWGSGLVRKYLYLATLRLIQHDAVVKAWYTKAVAADGLRKMRALVAVMRKLIRALWHVSHGEAFDSRKLFNVGLLAEFGEDESGTGSAVNDQKSGCEESA